jgi:hypothetical protein
VTAAVVAGLIAAATSTESDTSWPPALVYFAIGLLFASLGAVGTVFWRAHKSVKARR